MRGRAAAGAAEIPVRRSPRLIARWLRYSPSGSRRSCVQTRIGACPTPSAEPGDCRTKISASTAEMFRRRMVDLIEAGRDRARKQIDPGEACSPSRAARPRPIASSLEPARAQPPGSPTLTCGHIAKNDPRNLYQQHHSDRPAWWAGGVAGGGVFLCFLFFCFFLCGSRSSNRRAPSPTGPVFPLTVLFSSLTPPRRASPSSPLLDLLITASAGAASFRS